MWPKFVKQQIFLRSKRDSTVDKEHNLRVALLDLIIGIPDGPQVPPGMISEKKDRSKF